MLKIKGKTLDEIAGELTLGAAWADESRRLEAVKAWVNTYAAELLQGFGERRGPYVMDYEIECVCRAKLIVVAEAHGRPFVAICPRCGARFPAGMLSYLTGQTQIVRQAEAIVRARMDDLSIERVKVWMDDPVPNIAARPRPVFPQGNPGIRPIIFSDAWKAAEKPPTLKMRVLDPGLKKSTTITCDGGVTIGALADRAAKELSLEGDNREWRLLNTLDGSHPRRDKTLTELGLGEDVALCLFAGEAIVQAGR